MGKIKNTIEKWHYKSYAKMNVARKSKEKTNPLYKALDDFRRKTGYVK